MCENDYNNSNFQNTFVFGDRSPKNYNLKVESCRIYAIQFFFCFLVSQFYSFHSFLNLNGFDNFDSFKR